MPIVAVPAGGSKPQPKAPLPTATTPDAALTGHAHLKRSTAAIGVAATRAKRDVDGHLRRQAIHLQHRLCDRRAGLPSAAAAGERIVATQQLNAQLATAHVDDEVEARTTADDGRRRLAAPERARLRQCATRRPPLEEERPTRRVDHDRMA